jgi:hypothetical protein
VGVGVGVSVCTYTCTYTYTYTYTYNIRSERASERERDQIYEVENILLEAGAAEAGATFQKLLADTYVRIHIRLQ